jgi:prepilin-type N-terminal cleavage/methylation domain-containing protein
MTTCSSNKRGSRRSEGFSLVELLVAMAVLAIIGLIIVQLTSSTANVTRLSNRSIDASAQARLAFDRIGLDLKSLVRRDDIDLEAGNPISATRSDVLLFFSSVTSQASSLSTWQNRGLSLVAYRIALHPDNLNKKQEAIPCLVRAGKAMPWAKSSSWSASGFMGLKGNGLPVRLDDDASAFPSDLLPTAPSATTASDYDVLASGVIRIVVGFQLYPDKKLVTLLDGSTIPGGSTGQGQIVYSPPVKTLVTKDGLSTSVKYIDVSRISAVVIGLVTLDLENAQLLSAEQINTISQKFSVPDVSATTLSCPVQAWGGIADSLASSLSASVPVKALQSVRVYQRFFPITPFGTR